MDISDLKIGDRITFKSPTRDGARTLTRIVNGFWPNGLPMVRAHGWNGFVVKSDEISEIIPKEQSNA